MATKEPLTDKMTDALQALRLACTQQPVLANTRTPGLSKHSHHKPDTKAVFTEHCTVYLNSKPGETKPQLQISEKGSWGSSSCWKEAQVGAAWGAGTAYTPSCW